MNLHRSPALRLLQRHNGTCHDVCFQGVSPGVLPVNLTPSLTGQRLFSGGRFTGVSIGRADHRCDLFSLQTLGELKFFASDRRCFLRAEMWRRVGRTGGRTPLGASERFTLRQNWHNKAASKRQCEWGYCYAIERLLNGYRWLDSRNFQPTNQTILTGFLYKGEHNNAVLQTKSTWRNINQCGILCVMFSVLWMTRKIHWLKKICLAQILGYFQGSFTVNCFTSGLLW